jgi:hypothetical protein
MWTKRMENGFVDSFNAPKKLNGRINKKIENPHSVKLLSDSN